MEVAWNKGVSGCEAQRARSWPSALGYHVLELARAGCTNQQIEERLGLTYRAVKRWKHRLIQTGHLKPSRSPGPVSQEIRDYVLGRPDSLTATAVAREVAERFGRKIDHKTVFNIRETRYW